jgi:hypothetical protein
MSDKNQINNSKQDYSNLNPKVNYFSYNYSDVHNHVFFKIKEGKKFFYRLELLIVSFLLHLKYQEEYKTLKQKKIELMRLVNKNYSIIYSLLEQLYSILPVKKEDLIKLKQEKKDEELEQEKRKKLVSSKKEIKKEVDELEKLKKEVEELELHVLKLINEK